MAPEKELGVKEIQELLSKAGLSVEALRGLAAYCEKGGCQLGCPSGCAPSCSTCSQGKSNGVSTFETRPLSILDEILGALGRQAVEIRALAAK